MEILRFASTDGIVEIKANTGADMARNWLRFKSRIGSDDAARTYCAYTSSIRGTLALCDTSGNALHTASEDSTTWTGLPPVFYETALYNVNIFFKGISGKPSIIHKMKEVCDLFSVIEMGNGNYLLSAPLSFLNEPGIFELSFKYTPIKSAQRVDTFSFRVVSPKLDTKADYNHILEEINREYNELVFQYLTKTLQNLSRGGKSRNDVVWLSIFRNIVEKYLKAVSYIVNRPHLQECHEVRYSRADKIKRWTPLMAEKYAELQESGRMENEMLRHEITSNTHNTRENRFVKFTIERIERRLNAIFTDIKVRNLSAKDEDKVTEEELSVLDSYQSRLRKLANSSLLRNIKSEPLHQESMVLQKRTGYAQVYRFWLILQNGIELYEGSNNIGVRPIWELYELWCFLKMRQLVADILGIDITQPNESFSEDKDTMLNPFSDSNLEHKSVFVNGDDVIELVYQHTYNRNSGEIHTATTDNRPDIVLTIKKNDGFELTYLFDAKYRVTDDNKFSDDDISEQKLLGAADYPPSDAINQMHRYRDAIYYGSKKNNLYEHSAKEIIGGYILFPGRGDDEAVRSRYYYKSIETVNIGAFPLLPNHQNPMCEGTLLREHLENILLKQTAYEQIKDSIPQRGLQYTPALPEYKDLVLVGYYKTGQLKPIFDNKLYYVPAAISRGSIELVSGFEKTKYLLLHHGQDRMLLELKGDGPKFYPAKALEEMGFSPNGDYYLGFELKSTVVIEGIDLNSYQLEKFRSDSTAPYFTTFDKLSKYRQ
jgi:hypothetical protein